MGSSLESLCHTKCHDKYIFVHAHNLKRQIDDLRDKMGMEITLRDDVHNHFVMRNVNLM